ncbi:hypothetical protein GGX14DRAFT_394428 [Mycena pura]|uniref:Uncharacterized protein n=1 Tax=Mycena pura TaxID=153505 RepID=A0AAD6YC05_9AGAR|nr:hypothetical protein GGX14DRAFT_394428 [Mycena pura]
MPHRHRISSKKSDSGPCYKICFEGVNYRGASAEMMAAGRARAYQLCRSPSAAYYDSLSTSRCYPPTSGSIDIEKCIRVAVILAGLPDIKGVLNLRNDRRSTPRTGAGSSSSEVPSRVKDSRTVTAPPRASGDDVVADRIPRRIYTNASVGRGNTMPARDAPELAMMLCQYPGLAARGRAALPRTRPCLRRVSVGVQEERGSPSSVSAGWLVCLRLRASEGGMEGDDEGEKKEPSDSNPTRSPTDQNKPP